ncbi:MAG: hypothetical protein U0R69_10030 [Gaiellales bacterium]
MSVTDGWDWFAACCELEGENAELRRVGHKLFCGYLRLLERVELAEYGRGLIEARFPEPEEPAP